jgi:hypothetical protein
MSIPKYICTIYYPPILMDGHHEGLWDMLPLLLNANVFCDHNGLTYLQLCIYPKRDIIVYDNINSPS